MGALHDSALAVGYGYAVLSTPASLVPAHEFYEDLSYDVVSSEGGVDGGTTYRRYGRAL